MLYKFKGSNGKIELYENKIVIIRNAFSTFPRGAKEIYIKKLTGVQIKKPGLTAGYIQFIFSGSKEIKSSKIMDSAYDENTVIFQSNGYQNALVLKQKIEELINKPNEARNQQTSTQPISQTDELLKFKQLLDSGAITEEEFQTQKNKILGVSEPDTPTSNDIIATYEELKQEQPQSPLNNKLNHSTKKEKKGKTSKKKAIIICIVLLFLLVGVISSSSNTPTNNPTSQDVDSTDANANISLNDIEEWYEDQMPAVSQSLIEHAKSVDGISAINVSDSEFRFGEDSGWYECHYTVHFTCKINGVVHSGESRAFLKYNEKDINWFHFEIFSNDDITSVVEHYDEEYDKIIEDYYKELISLYN